MLIVPRRYAMNKIRLNLEYCYGITRLKTDLDFSNHSAVAIYAPNGMMKSSLACTLDAISKNEKPSDRIYKDEVNTVYDVLDENGKQISPDSILVFGPYDKDFDPAKRISNLLLSSKLKQRYDALISGIDDAKDELLKAIRKQAQTKLNPESIEAEISNSVMRVGNEFLSALLRLRTEIRKQDVAPYAQLKYDTIFDQKVLDFISGQSAKDSIA